MPGETRRKRGAGKGGRVKRWDREEGKAVVCTTIGGDYDGLRVLISVMVGVITDQHCGDGDCQKGSM